MNYQPHPLSNHAQDERVIPLLTGFALGAPFWSNAGRQYYPYPYPYYPPYPYPYQYPYYRPIRRRRRWY